MTRASTFGEFMRFDTKGMSWRRMSPPPSVICCEKEIGTCRARLQVARAHRVVEDVGHGHLVAEEELAVGVVGGPVQRHVVAPGVGGRCR